MTCKCVLLKNEPFSVRWRWWSNWLVSHGRPSFFWGDFASLIKVRISPNRQTTQHSPHHNWLVVYLPLWKMMEFVSWGYYSQYMESHGQKCSNHHQPDKVIKKEDKWPFFRVARDLLLALSAFHILHSWNIHWISTELHEANRKRPLRASSVEKTWTLQLFLWGFHWGPRLYQSSTLWVCCRYSANLSKNSEGFGEKKNTSEAAAGCLQGQRNLLKIQGGAPLC